MFPVKAKKKVLRFLEKNLRNRNMILLNHWPILMKDQ